MGIQEEIAKVAYELYEKRGKSHGSHFDDWLQAEKIVMARHSGKKEAGVILPKAAGKIIAAVKSAKVERTKPAAKASSRKKSVGKKTKIEKT